MVSRGAAFPRCAATLVSRSRRAARRTLMRGSRTSKQSSSQCDVRFAASDSRLVGLRRTVRRNAARCWSQRDMGVPRCDMGCVALRQVGDQTARERRRAATSRISDCARTTTRCDKARVSAREVNVGLPTRCCRAAARRVSRCGKVVSRCDKVVSHCDMGDATLRFSGDTARKSPVIVGRERGEVSRNAPHGARSGRSGGASRFAPAPSVTDAKSS